MVSVLNELILHNKQSYSLAYTSLKFLVALLNTIQQVEMGFRDVN